MTPGRLQQLRLICGVVQKWRDDGVNHADVIERLQVRFGATLRFSAGAYVLRLAGIAGSSTMGGAPLVASWARAAQRAIAKEIAA